MRLENDTLLLLYRALIISMVKDGVFPYHPAMLPRDPVVDAELWDDSKKVERKEEENPC